MVKAVTMYQSTDGKMHSSMDEARSHDALYKCMSTVKAILQSPRMGDHANMMSLEIVNNPKAALDLREACNKVLDFHRKYGKLRKN